MPANSFVLIGMHSIGAVSAEDADFRYLGWKPRRIENAVPIARNMPWACALRLKGFLAGSGSRIAGRIGRSRPIAKSEQARPDDGRGIRVGSWPGLSYPHNEFISIFCRSLVNVGIEVVDVVDPRKTDPVSIDILHVHWPEQILWRGFGPIKTAGLALTTFRSIERMRSRGVVVVWMVHNLRPHDVSGAQAIIWSYCVRRMRALADAFMTLSPATTGKIELEFKFPQNLPRLSVRHPSYETPAVADKKAARVAANTGNPVRLLVFAGQVKRYKGLEGLTQAVVRSGSDTHLVIAGECSDLSLAATLQDIAAEAGGRIILRLKRQANDEFASLVCAADYVVLPFKNYLHSGSIVHALSLGSPVLTPNHPYARDLASVVGGHWIQLFDGAISPEIINSLPAPDGGQPDLDALDPALIATATANFYARLLSKTEIATDD